MKFLQDHGIHITAYMSLAYGEVIKDPVIQAIAGRHQATPAQVALAWALQQGFSVIPSSTKRENLASNLEAAAIRLTDEDMAQIASSTAAIAWRTRKASRRPGIDSNDGAQLLGRRRPSVGARLIDH